MLLTEAWENYQWDKMLVGYSLQTLKAYLVKDSEKLKLASLVHRIRFVKSIFFRWANEEGIVKNNPARKLKEPKNSIRIPKFLTEKEIEYLREAC